MTWQAVGVIAGIVFGLVGISSAVITHRAFRITVQKFQLEKKDRERDMVERDKAHEVELIQAERRRADDIRQAAIAACREFTGSEEYTKKKEQRIRELSREEIRAEFAERAPSFVDAGVFAQFEKNIDERLGRMQDSITDNTRAVSEQTGRISADVANQVNAFLLAQMSKGSIRIVGLSPEKG